MTDEMKLLTSLCNVLGYKVEVELDYDERKEYPSEVMRYNFPFQTGDRQLVVDNQGRLYIDEDGFYRSKLTKPTKSFKLSKENK